MAVYNPSLSHAVAITGNTSGALATITTGTMFMAGGNNVTLSQNGNSITFSAANQTNQTVPAGNIAGAGFTSTTTAGTAVVATHNSAGLSMGIPTIITNALTTAALSNHSHNFATTTTNGSQIVVGTNNSIGATIGVPAFLTTYVAQTNQTVASGNIAGVGTTFGGTNVSGSMTLNSNGLNLAVSAIPAVNTSQSSLFQQTSAMSNFAGTSTGFTGTNISASMTHNSQGLALQLSVNPGGAGGGVVIADGVGDTGTNGTIIFSNANGVSFNLSTAANGSHTMYGSVDAGGAGAALTFMTYQNRQLGASSSTQMTNGQIWMVPFRVAGGYVSASTVQYIQSLSGTYTSAVAATHGETMRWCIYSANATNSSVFDSASSGSFTWQFWNSGTSSGSWAYNGLTSSSAGTGVLTQAAGVRMMNMPFGSSLAPGLYMMALMQSSTTAGYSALLSRYGVVMDSPMPLAMGNGFGTATATSIGYVDAGTFSATSAAFPTQVNLSQVRQHSNLVPYFKIGAL